MWPLLCSAAVSDSPYVGVFFCRRGERSLNSQEASPQERLIAQQAPLVHRLLAEEVLYRLPRVFSSIGALFPVFL